MDKEIKLTEQSVNLEEIMENMVDNKYTEKEWTSLPCSGDAPPVDSSWPWWSYDGKRAIVGRCADELEIVDYDYFID